MIHISKPFIGDEEKRNVLEVLESGMLAQGPRVAELEKKFAQLCGVKHAIATSSGTTVELIYLNQNPTDQFTANGSKLIEQAQTDYSFARIVVLSNQEDLPEVHDSMRKSFPNLLGEVNGLGEIITNSLNQTIRASQAEFICLIEGLCTQSAPGWLRTLMAMAAQPGIGCVSPKLVNQHGLIHSCGLILTDQKLVQRLFNGAPAARLNHYFGWSSLHKGYSALPSACMLFKKSDFVTVGGFNTKLVDHSARGIDLCLKMRQIGLRSIIVPEVSMNVDNLPTQDPEDDLILSHSDKAILYQAYKKWFEADPAFNPNLALHRGMPTVSKIPRKVI